MDLQKTASEYDYVIAGAGLSGLCLAWDLIHSTLKNQQILIVDADLNTRNNKTWCFWHHGKPPFPDLIQKSWEQAEVIFSDVAYTERLSEYTYHCIIGSTFKRFVLDRLRNHPSVDLLEAKIQNIAGNDSYATLSAGGKSFRADYIFQSVFKPKESESPVFYPLIQHFMGWEIETEQPVFDPAKFTFMDFDESYPDGIAFFYLLPMSATKALLEYTIFSREVELREVYERKLRRYTANRLSLPTSDFKIGRTEYGKIPMEYRSWNPLFAPRVVNLGTVGGLTKPSTGYTFTRTKKHARQIVQRLEQGEDPVIPGFSKKRYHTYDLWLLEMMYDRPQEALRVLKSLFNNNPMDEIFRFLGEETHFGQDLKIMSSVPPLPFLKAIWNSREVY